MGLNIEIKARCPDLQLVKAALENLPVQFEGIDNQVDTFFQTPAGRLKLRRSAIYGNLLIPYIRPNQIRPKSSQYALIRLSETDKIEYLLNNILGIRLVVSKKREIYLYENVRIHLDQVEHLGEFIELEAVIKHEKELDENHKKVQFLMDVFNINQNDLIELAYADLLEKQNQGKKDDK